MKFLPSKRILVLIAIILSLGIIVWAVFSNKKPSIATKVNEATDDIKNKDTDLDGLKNWEEALWGTDPENADTDRDGISDGDEVKQGRNPAISGAGNLTDITVGQKIATPKNDQEKLTATDMLSRDFFAKFMSAKEANPNITDSDKEAIIVELLQKNYLGTTKTYSASEIKTFGNETELLIRAYGNNLGSIVVNQPEAGKEDELVIFQKAVDGKDEKKIAELDAIIKNYEKILYEFLSLRVPLSAKEEHLALLNAVSAILENIKGMRSYFEDPVRGFISFSKQQESAIALRDAFSGLFGYFNRQNIRFAQDEYGYILNQII